MIEKNFKIFTVNMDEPRQDNGDPYFPAYKTESAAEQAIEEAFNDVDFDEYELIIVPYYIKD